MSLFWNPNDSATIVEMPLEIITTGTQDMGNGVYWLKAGTPLDEYFAVSNDEDAVYLVAEDFYFISTKPDQAKIVPLITAGYVDLNKAEAAAGITYTDACLSALETAGIVMVDGTISGGGGSSGGGVFVVNLSENYVCDKTAGEMLAAMETVGVVIKIAFPDETTIMPVIAGYGKSSGFGFGVYTDDGILYFTAETENGYPVLQSDGGE